VDSPKLCHPKQGNASQHQAFPPSKDRLSCPRAAVLQRTFPARYMNHTCVFSRFHFPGHCHPEEAESLVQRATPNEGPMHLENDHNPAPKERHNLAPDVSPGSLAQRAHAPQGPHGPQYHPSAFLQNPMDKGTTRCNIGAKKRSFCL